MTSRTFLNSSAIGLADVHREKSRPLPSVWSPGPGGDREGGDAPTWQDTGGARGPPQYLSGSRDEEKEEPGAGSAGRRQGSKHISPVVVTLRPSEVTGGDARER